MKENCDKFDAENECKDGLNGTFAILLMVIYISDLRSDPNRNYFFLCDQSQMFPTSPVSESVSPRGRGTKLQAAAESLS